MRAPLMQRCSPAAQAAPGRPTNTVLRARCVDSISLDAKLDKDLANAQTVKISVKTAGDRITCQR